MDSASSVEAAVAEKSADQTITVLHSDGIEITISRGGRIIRGAVERRGGRVFVHHRGLVYEIEAAAGRRAAGLGAAPAASDLFAPMTGTVVQVFAKEADAVSAGASLMIVEAMKMEHKITAPAAATILRMHVKAGDKVDVGAPLVSLKLDAAK
jgi:propionyl-CoA carboxylase alpha chain